MKSTSFIILFTEKVVSSDAPNFLRYETVSTYSLSIFTLPVMILCAYTISLLRHAFFRLRYFHHFSLSHFRSHYMLLVTMISLLQTFLAVPCLFWEAVTLVPKATLTFHNFTMPFLFTLFFVLFSTSLSSVEARLTALYFHSSYPLSWKKNFCHISYLLH